MDRVPVSIHYQANQHHQCLVIETPVRADNELT